MENTLQASTISGINRLPAQEKQKIYTQLIPPELLERYSINPLFTDVMGNKLLKLSCSPDCTDVEMELRNQADAEDPVLYGHLTDTINGRIHILLYVLNDPESPRFDIDRMPDGSTTYFGTQKRNLEAELAALQFGLAPGQVHQGLRLLGSAIQAFERFVQALGHDLFFAEPLFYHNAIIFERYGFNYQKGRKLMNRIQSGFSPSGDLAARLDGSSPFRRPGAQASIRLRSWAIHDNLLGESFTNVTMYKHVGKTAGIDTSSGCEW